MGRPVASHGQVVQGDFVPHPLMTDPHLQTLSSMVRPTPRLEFTRERWERPDGDFVDVGYCGAGNGPRAVLLHGLTGGFESKYLRGLARQLLSAGWRCVLMQFRGAGPEPNRLPRAYHQGDTGDLRDLVGRLHAEEPATPLFAVGWSLGGNVLLKYLGESGGDCPLAGAVAISVPFQLEPCAQRLRTGFSRVYQNHLLAELKAGLRAKAARMPMPIDVAAGLRARDFYEFDDSVVAPLNGFRDALDYYSRCSSAFFLRGITCPTHILHAEDDPFMSPAIVPRAHDLPPAVTLELTRRGGHVGFIAANRGGLPYCWLEQRVPAHLNQAVQALGV